MRAALRDRRLAAGAEERGRRYKGGGGYKQHMKQGRLKLGLRRRKLCARGAETFFTQMARRERRVGREERGGGKEPCVLAVGRGEFLGGAWGREGAQGARRAACNGTLFHSHTNTRFNALLSCETRAGGKQYDEKEGGNKKGGKGKEEGVVAIVTRSSPRSAPARAPRPRRRRRRP